MLTARLKNQFKTRPDRWMRIIAENIGLDNYQIKNVDYSVRMNAKNIDVYIEGLEVIINTNCYYIDFTSYDAFDIYTSKTLIPISIDDKNKFIYNNYETFNDSISKILLIHMIKELEVTDDTSIGYAVAPTLDMSLTASYDIVLYR